MTLPFAEAELALIERAAQCLRFPKIRALHLPPVDTRKSKDGEFCAIELDDGSIGLSYVLLGGTLDALLAQEPGESLAGMDALELCRWYRRPDTSARTLGFAAVNAMTSALYAKSAYEPNPSADSIAMLDPRPGDHVGMIGFFPPLAKRIAKTGAALTIAELRDDLVGQYDGYRVTLDANDLSACNKILSTSTVLLNDTLDAMLSTCSGATQFALIGPGAGCLPDPLFERGVSLLGGTQVKDRAAFCEALRAGKSWGEFAKKVVVSTEDYPGFEALLARLT